MSSSTRYAVLGLLVERRGYGYDLMQRLNERVGPAATLNPGSVYSALDSLEGEQLVRSSQRQEPAPPSPTGRSSRERRMYDVTAAGVTTYEHWVRTPAKVDLLRNDLALKVAVFRPEDAVALLEIVDRYEIACLERLEEHSRAADAALGAPGTWTLSSRSIAHERGNRLLNAEIDWVRDVRRAVMDMHAQWLQTQERGSPDGGA